jgi:hypothetical protein
MTGLDNTASSHGLGSRDPSRADTAPTTYFFSGTTQLHHSDARFECLPKAGAGELLAHQAGEVQERAAWPVVHHDVLGLPGGVAGASCWYP